MIIQSTPVSFGALGTPILVGVKQGLDLDNAFEAGHSIKTAATSFGLVTDGANSADLLQILGLRVALLHGIIGTMIPLIMVSVLTRFFGPNRSFREGLACWRFALFAAFAMTFPSVLTAFFLGPEFPSLFGGMCGLVIVVLSLRAGIFQLPGEPFRFDESAQWPVEWSPVESHSTAESATDQLPAGDQSVESAAIKKMSLVTAWLPYLLLADTQ